jgi:hypothetical protein
MASIMDKVTDSLGYIASYKGKRVEVYAPTILQARNIAASKLGVKPKNAYKIAIMLAEKNGQPVVHSTSELG